MTEPIVSLCIPTNGIAQWVFPVLDSIYSQNVPNELFEVVVMDNGNDSEFKKLMVSYSENHENLVYKETKAREFLSEIETYKASKGAFIKFINHRTKLCSCTLQKYIDFANDNKEEKPFVYFAEGNLKLKNEVTVCGNFNEFVQNLSFFSSWSTGMAFWREDFLKIDLSAPNSLFPHTAILFGVRDKAKYIIYNEQTLDEIPVGKIPKGKYNLFYAFGVEFVNIIFNLYRDGDITFDTFLSVKADNLRFVCDLYFKYIFLKRKCSYDLSEYEKSLNCFYNARLIGFYMPTYFLKKCIGKIMGRKKL